MKYLFVLTLFVSVTGSLFSQSKINKTDSCSCTTSRNIGIPTGYNGTYGTVIIEFEVDTNCIYVNPVVLKSVSKELDEVALNAMKNTILQLNRCRIKCPIKKCKEVKFKQPITFLSEEDKK